MLMKFEEPLKEYVHIVQEIKTVIADRALAFKQQQELTESVKLKELNLEKLRFIRPEKDISETEEQPQRHTWISTQKSNIENGQKR